MTDREIIQMQLQKVADYCLINRLVGDADLYCEKPYHANDENIANYLKALMLLREMTEDGICKYKADDPRKAYVIHMITVSFTDEDALGVNIAPDVKRKVMELCSYLSSAITIDRETLSVSFYSELYTEGK